LREHIQRYYKDLFGSEDSGTIHLSENIWSLHGSLSDAEAQDLVKPFTIPKLECALVDMDASSAPRLDGLSVGFYREFWPKIKDVMLEMFQKLFEGSLNLSRLNYGLISLIPKLKDPNTIKQYKPICLLNVDCKLFTKVLTMRLTPFAGKLVSATQTAFIPGRYILEGVIMLHELLHELRVKKLKGVILKLDFEKAYNKVHWGFMMEVLKKKNFLEKWPDWMHQIIEGDRVGININGDPGNYFRTFKGLRLGTHYHPSSSTW
jgi:hypothetical protein